MQTKDTRNILTRLWNPTIFLDRWQSVFAMYLALASALHWRVFTKGLLLATPGDAITYNYPMRHFYATALKEFNFPLWNPQAFAGVPFVGLMQTGALYPPNMLLFGLLDVRVAFNLTILLHMALAGHWTYLYLRKLDLHPAAAFAGGFVFAFTGFIAGTRFHMAILTSASYLPLIVLALEGIRKGGGLQSAYLLAMAVALQFLGGNFQVCLYTYWVSGLYVLWYMFENAPGRRGRFFGLALLGGVLGLLLAAPQLVATLQHSSQSELQQIALYRGYPYFSLYNLDINMLPTFFFPKLLIPLEVVDTVSPHVGPVVVTLALVAFFVRMRTDRTALLWGLVALVGLVLALGGDTPLNELLYRVPVYNMMRAHGRNLLTVGFAMSVLVAMGLHGAFTKEEARKCGPSGSRLPLARCC